MSAEVQDRIRRQVEGNAVLLFMKGDPQLPQCGFSAKAVQVLSSYGVGFETIDVLSDPQIRSGIKEFAGWPTIPQLYIGGEFIGGCDIIVEMHENGELGRALDGVCG